VLIVIKEVQWYGISTDVKKLWKEFTSPKASRLGVLARAGTSVLMPLWFRAARSDLQDHVPPFQNWMDSRSLSAAEQAKSVRGPVLTFTWHSQLFHKQGKCASTEKVQRKCRDLEESMEARPENALKLCNEG
jgi:hypothetical protein